MATSIFRRKARGGGPIFDPHHRTVTARVRTGRRPRKRANTARLYEHGGAQNRCDAATRARRPEHPDLER